MKGIQAMQCSQLIDRMGEELSCVIQSPHIVVWLGHREHIKRVVIVVHAFLLMISICVIKHGRYLRNFGKRILQYASRSTELVQLQHQRPKLRLDLNFLCRPYIVGPTNWLIPIKNRAASGPYLGQKICHERNDCNGVGSLSQELLGCGLLIGQVARFPGGELLRPVDVAGHCDRNAYTHNGHNKTRDGGSGLDNCRPFFRGRFVKNERVQVEA